LCHTLVSALSTLDFWNQVATILGWLGNSSAVGPSDAFNGYLNNDDYDVYSTNISSPSKDLLATLVTVDIYEILDHPHFFLLLEESILKRGMLSTDGFVGVEIDNGNLDSPTIKSTLPN